MSQPIPPTNVRVEYPDGTTVPLECVYRGYERGIHQWAAVISVPLVAGAHLRIDVLPAHTGVGIEWWES